MTIKYIVMGPSKLIELWKVLTRSVNVGVRIKCGKTLRAMCRAPTFGRIHFIPDRFLWASTMLRDRIGEKDKEKEKRGRILDRSNRSIDTCLRNNTTTLTSKECYVRIQSPRTNRCKTNDKIGQLRKLYLPVLLFAIRYRSNDQSVYFFLSKILLIRLL